MTKIIDNWAILMAGGNGERLRPITGARPKPLIQVGDRPILETIILKLKTFGFRKFFFCVYYKADIIREYFDDGGKWGVDIQYVVEEKPLGTAGGLRLLPGKPDQSMLVMNADLLTRIDFTKLLRFHTKQEAAGTMCVREYCHKVPFGVVRTEGHLLTGIEEKPVSKTFVNAGIYVLEPEALDLIPENTRYDMPQLFESLLQRDLKAAIFPIKDYWFDIGQNGDLEKAKSVFKNNSDEI